MRHRDAGIGEPADPRRDARHDTERNAGFDQRQGFLAAASEHEGVATLQPTDPFAGARHGNELQRDIALLRRGLSAALAGILDCRAGPRMLQHTLSTRAS